MKCEILTPEAVKTVFRGMFSDEENEFALYELDLHDKKLYPADMLSVATIRNDLKNEWIIFLRIWE